MFYARLNHSLQDQWSKSFMAFINFGKRDTTFVSTHIDPPPSSRSFSIWFRSWSCSFYHARAAECGKTYELPKLPTISQQYSLDDNLVMSIETYQTKNSRNNIQSVGCPVQLNHGHTARYMAPTQNEPRVLTCVMRYCGVCPGGKFGMHALQYMQNTRRNELWFTSIFNDVTRLLRLRF